ncbi:hypothetical protein J2R99_000763 [Rhodopseudomonas julia]|uniref:Uncharacterized protein n=1 Tax=Rhodopseudomonas julia TaxID=200617 RepID=A0ABU0C331_9BRAD|nr:hypothetical protein [Rhodopseudomonas julia]MDQ0324914.1 hypothetical protein [Rhodopseudomonas julia]
MTSRKTLLAGVLAAATLFVPVASMAASPDGASPVAMQQTANRNGDCNPRSDWGRSNQQYRSNAYQKHGKHGAQARPRNDTRNGTCDGSVCSRNFDRTRPGSSQQGMNGRNNDQRPGFDRRNDQRPGYDRPDDRRNDRRPSAPNGGASPSSYFGNI